MAEQLGVWSIQEKRKNGASFSGLEKTNQEGDSNSNLLAVYIQGAVEMIETEIKMKGQETAVTSATEVLGGLEEIVFYDQH